MKQEIKNIIEWATMACEETRAIYDKSDDPYEQPPSWVPELEAALEKADNE